MVLLHFEVALVGGSHGGGGQPVDLVVNVHEQRHRRSLPAQQGPL
jgi:hypothetical protein